jgi:Uma2 family endonuclease
MVAQASIGFDYGSNQGPRLSLAGWGDLLEDEPGELVNGCLVEEEMPSVLHEAIVVWLMAQLWNWLFPRGGNVLGSEAKFAVGESRGRKPDVSAYLPGSKLPRPRESLVRTPPSLMVEVLSPRARDIERDRTEKPHDYASFGVRWYWLVDPESRTLEIFELGESRRYSRVLEATRGVVAVPGCEGLLLDLDALWAHADRFEAAVHEDEGVDDLEAAGLRDDTGERTI